MSRRFPRRRYRRRHPGSVLVLAVALLVLLALIGTAYLATSGTDRRAAVQHGFNTELDLLVEGVVSLVKGELVDDLFGDPDPARNNERAFRPGSGPMGRFENFDSPAVDLWMAHRVPEVQNPGRPPTPPDVAPLSLYGADGAGTNPPLWRAVSWPLIRNTPDGRGHRFDRPDGGPVLPLDDAAKQDYAFAPTAAALSGQGAWPFLRVYRRGVPVPDEQGGLIPAADADGDGIADAGLWKLPVDRGDGITWYAAVRVIDNNSAVNLNTALSRDFDFLGDGTAVHDARTFYTSRVGLAELLRTSNPKPARFSGAPSGPGPELDGLNLRRFNGCFPSGVAGAGGASGAGNWPVDDAGQARGDFRFSGVAEALWSQLGRRPDNPGFVAAGTRFAAFGATESAAVRYHFCLANPDLAPGAPLERLLAPSLLSSGAGPVPDRAFAPDAVLAWYWHLDYAQEVPGKPETYRHRRSLVTTRNPLSNLAPAKFSRTRAPGAAGELSPGGVPNPGMRPYWPFAAPPPSPLPAVPRTNVNTADFGELWRAFWNVMADDRDPDRAPVDESAALARLNPFFGSRFEPESRTDVIEEFHPAMMFRSSIRDVRGGYSSSRVVRFRPFHQLLLRAALAAVNAEDLRDADDDVTSHQIVLEVDRNGVLLPAAVVVYGTERQPFVTEVAVDPDNLTPGPGGNVNPRGYVAVELHNPYDRPIVLSPAGAGAPGDGWAVAMVDRSRSSPAGVVAKPSLELRNLDGSVPDASAAPWRFPPGTVVPARGFLVLENYDATGKSADPLRARYRPPSVVGDGPGPADPRRVLAATGQPRGGSAKVVYVPNLHRVVPGPSSPERMPPGWAGPAETRRTGGELVVLRTRRADARSSSAPGQYDEVANLHDLAPAAQFDFTGCVLYSGNTPSRLMHYFRPTAPPPHESGGAADPQWQFVYPGRYNGDGGGVVLSDTYRHQGTRFTDIGTWPSDQPQPNLGARDANFYAVFGPTIQLSSAGFGGPNRLAAGSGAGPQQHPFGAFARDGDILQVPFIGAYTVFDPAPASPGPAGAPRLLEINSVSVDSIFAEDTDPQTDEFASGMAAGMPECVGRFGPVFSANSGAPDAGTRLYDDFRQGSTNRYRWATDLFDHLTVRAPHADYFPDVSPAAYRAAGAGPRPEPVANTVPGRAGDPDRTDPLGVANDHAEDLETVDGLINVNTAPWPVLASLPLALEPASTGTRRITSADVARAIAYNRDVDADFRKGPGMVRPHGPFKTVQELNSVLDPLAGFGEQWLPIFSWADRVTFHGPTEVWINDADDAAGDFSPPGAGKDGAYDFEDYFLTMTRVSNLVTTRSDSYTCYVVVQGWRGAGTPQARMEVQRRVAFDADRSGVTANNREVAVQFFYNP